jgi:hypothetical protein
MSNVLTAHNAIAGGVRSGTFQSVPPISPENENQKKQAEVHQKEVQHAGNADKEIECKASLL